MYSYEFDFLLKLIANERVCKEAHADPNEEMCQNLVDYPVMSRKPVNGHKLRMYISLELTFY